MSYILLITMTLISPFVRTGMSEAERLYHEERYSEALMIYERMMETEPPSAELFYNAGIACYRMRLYGRSIWYYRQAMLISPNDDDIINNLRVAESSLQKPPPVSVPFSLAGFMRGVLMFIPSSVTLIIFILAWNMMFYFIISGMLSREENKTKAFRYIKYPGMIVIVCLLIFTGDAIYLRRYTEAVILKGPAEVRPEPFMTSRPDQMIFEGWRAEVLDLQPEWIHIRLDNGKEGWILTDVAGIVRRD